MRRSMKAAAMSCAAVVLLAGAAAADGHARVVIPFDLEGGAVAEGVAVDAAGNVYTGLSAKGRMLKIPAQTGEVEALMELDGLEEGDFGLVGHAVGPTGRLFSAVISGNPALNGIVSIDPVNGEWVHLEGTERIGTANAIAADPGGALFVSDMAAGAVWLVVPDAVHPGEAMVEPWVQHELLEGTNEFPYPYPIGANGIALREATVYVANTEKSTIVAIPVGGWGTAGEPSVRFTLEGVAPDGIAFGPGGDLYVADPPGQTLWRVTTDGEVSAVADADDGLAGPSSVALWTDADGVTTAYVTNQAIGPEGTVKHGPSLMAITLE